MLDETINLWGIPVRLMDTAGIRESQNEVEAIGISRSVKTIEKAQLILFVVDASEALTKEDISLYGMIKDKAHIVVLNKTDKAADKELGLFFEKETSKAAVSAKEGTGMGELEGMIFKQASSDSSDEMQSAVAVNARHNDLLNKAYSSLSDALCAIRDGATQDLAETDIRRAWQYLGKITGETADEDIIDEIFANFCLGK